MLILPPGPMVTISEPEIGLRAFAAKYAEAIGEPVDVLPSVERRAVAVFAKNESWERIIGLAGEAAGFRIARKAGRLRMESTRFDDLASLERDLNKRLAVYASPPSDIEATHRLYWAARDAVQNEREKPSGDPARLAQLVKKRDVLASVRNPQCLVLARYLKRGGKLPLGKTVLVRFGDYVSAREFALYSESNPDSPVPHFAAFRADDQEVEIAIDPGSFEGWPGWNPDSLPLEGTEERISKPSERALREVPWSKVAPPVIGALGIYRIGDVLGWIHRATGRPSLGAAPRIGLPRLEDNLPEALATGPIRVSVRDGAFVATTRYGDGLWPGDLDPLERQESPTIASVSAFCASAPAIWDALLGREYGSIASSHGVMFNGGLPFLRLLGRATSTGLARLRNEERTAVASLDTGSATAVGKFLTEDAAPLKAIMYAERGVPAITLKFFQSEAILYSTATGWTDSIETLVVAQYPDFWQSVRPEFVLRAPGIQEKARITVADGEEGTVVSVLSIARATGLQEPLVR